MKKYNRPDWDTYFMSLAEVISTRANCLKRRVGAVIVKNRRIISTGYNGTPSGIKNCFEGGCKRCATTTKSGENLAECVCSHAEENAITQAAYHGIALKDSSLYCTLSPCLLCARMIIGAGIKEVIFKEEYCFEEQTKALLKEAGIKIRKWEKS